METELNVKRLWFDGDRIFMETEDGKKLSQSLLWYHRLLHATPEQRNKYRFSYSGIHWEEIDEDVSFESFTRKNDEPEGISKLFLSHPELNASAVARKMGMKQSLLSAYIHGHKKPSKTREMEIRRAIRKIGRELAAV
ncbi:MAG: DUF2442 domain-containing protein [Tannerella sp.]|jgi:hypothetical protein|nr:DUF2442 domain-containing protein [Tannerella sp.]